MRILRVFIWLCACASFACAQLPSKDIAPPISLNVSGSTVTIPRITHVPAISHFMAMRPDEEVDGKLVKISNFIQRDPKDNQPAVSKTDAYLAYDEKNLYIVFICFDDQPKSVRARLARRDSIGPEDDEVQVYLDTFNDHRRSYGFLINPRGVQFDYLWTEERQYDDSYDQVWYSEDRVTDGGWIGWLAIPFKSVRFPKTPQQTWGLLLAARGAAYKRKSFLASQHAQCFRTPDAGRPNQRTLRNLARTKSSVHSLRLRTKFPGTRPPRSRESWRRWRSPSRPCRTPQRPSSKTASSSTPRSTRTSARSSLTSHRSRPINALKSSFPKSVRSFWRTRITSQRL